jgi:hypothetical protein
MTKAPNSELEKVLKMIVASAEKRLAHLPPNEAAAARKKIRRIAAETASQSRRKSSKAVRTRVRRVSSKSRVKSS